MLWTVIMETGFLLFIIVGIAFALAITQLQGRPTVTDHEDVIEFIKNMRLKYESQLQEYSSRYEQRMEEYETKLKAYENRIKELEQTLRGKDECNVEAEKSTGEVDQAAILITAKAGQEDKTKAQQDALRRRSRLAHGEGAAPVAFYAQLTNDATGIGNYQTIVFDQVTTNVGNAYNELDGIFTAPGNGVYAFIWTASNNRSTHMQTEIVANAVIKGRQWSDSGDHPDVSSATGSAVLNLQAGDIVWIRSNTIHNHVIMGSQLSSFSGWLLF